MIMFFHKQITPLRTDMYEWTFLRTTNMTNLYINSRRNGYVYTYSKKYSKLLSKIGKKNIQVEYIVRFFKVRCNVLESIFMKIKVRMFNHLRFKYDTKTNHVFRFFFLKEI